LEATEDFGIQLLITGVAASDEVHMRLVDLRPDLDVDSLNDDGFDLTEPSRSAEEEVREDIPGDLNAPGKIIVINNNDDDGDGVPDFADGYNLDPLNPDDDDPAFDDSQTPELEPEERFVPLVIQLPDGVDLEDVRVRFLYAASDPAAVTTSADDEGFPVYTLPEEGSLRIWNVDGKFPRNASSIIGGAGSYVAPDVDYTVSDLSHEGQIGPRTWRFYIEAVKPSEVVGDLRITLEFDPDGEGPLAALEDSVRLTSIGSRPIGINADGTLDRSGRIELSMPAPVFSSVSTTVRNLRFNEDHTAILADLRIVGRLDDAASDTLRGKDGVIGSVALHLNGLTEPLATIPTRYRKVAGGPSLLKRHDFSATFDHVVHDVELEPGWNVLSLYAVNVYGFSGVCETSVEVRVQAPPDVEATVEMQFEGSLSLGMADTIDVLITINGSSVGWTLTETGAGTGRFEGEGIAITLDPELSFDPNELDWTTVSIEYGGLEELDDYYGSVWTVGEAQNSQLMRGVRLLGDYERTDYRDFSVEVARITAPMTSGPGTFAPTTLEILGPEAMMPRMMLQIGERPLAVDPVSDLRTLILVDPNRDPWLGMARPKLQELIQPFEIVEQEWDTVAYWKGIAFGLYDTPCEIVTGVVSLVEMSGKVAWHGIRNYNLFSVAYRVIAEGRVLTVEDSKRLEGGVEMARNLGDIALRLLRHEAGFFERLVLGDDPAINVLGERMAKTVEFCAEVWDALMDSASQLTEFELGRIIGRISGEVLLAVATAGVGSALKGATMVSVIDRVANVAYMNKVLPVLEKLRTAFSTIFQTSKMCFVAGTSVHTAVGLKNIEDIRSGDLVLSRNEATGEVAYRPVLSTVVTRPDALYTVTYDPDGSGPLPEGRLVTTAPHPFYAANRGGFVAAGELLPGDELILADGTTADVIGITIERATPGQSFTTYNFEVAEFHTYFVATDGVWVHNAGGALCQKAISIFERHRRHLNESAESAFKTVETVLKKHINPKALPNDPMYIQHIGDVLDEVVKKELWPSSGEFWSPGNLGIGGRNAYAHYLDHVLLNKSGIPGGEFPDIHDAVTYVRNAREFLDSVGPDVVSWTKGTDRLVFNKATHWFAVEDTTGGSHIIRTFFHSNLKDSNGNPLTMLEWVRARGYTGPAF